MVVYHFFDNLLSKKLKKIILTLLHSTFNEDFKRGCFKNIIFE